MLNRAQATTARRALSGQWPAALMVGLGLLLGAPTVASAELSAAAKRGRAVMLEAECNRCHAITDATGRNHGIAPAAREANCVTCHQWILNTKGDPAAIAEQRKTFPDWDRYLETIVHFTQLPDLGTLTRRVDPAFVRRFLDGPYDLRPHLDESMIPVKLSAAQKDAVVAYLTAINGAAAVPSGAAVAERASAPTVDSARITAGRQAFISHGCPTCHVVGNETLVPGFDQRFYRAVGAPGLLAPNLRHVRDRLPRSMLVRFILDPKAVDPQTAMTPMPVEPAAAELIADFLLYAPLTLEATVDTAAPELPVLERKVRYDEVYEEVLGKICVHCHMAPESNNGDGGAGNTGGLGFAGVALDLESWAGIERGLLRDGKRVSVLEPPSPGADPLLLQALLRRFGEAGRDHRPVLGDHLAESPAASTTRPGMPLGLPPLSVMQLRMIKTWLAQGAPGPGG